MIENDILIIICFDNVEARFGWFIFITQPDPQITYNYMF